jgi:hypothetical protein
MFDQAILLKITLLGPSASDSKFAKQEICGINSHRIRAPILDNGKVDMVISDYVPDGKS